MKTKPKFPPRTRQALFALHASQLRSQADRVEVLASLMRPLELAVPLDFDTALKHEHARLMRMTKAQLISELNTEVELVARQLTSRFTKKEKRP